MLEPIRVLHVLGATNIGGAESRIMDMYRNIDKKNVQFDFHDLRRRGARGVEHSGGICIRHTGGKER